MSPDEFLKGQATLLAWRDGQEYGTNACIGILFVIRNQAKKMDGDWLSAVSYLTLLNNPRSDFPDVRDPSFVQILHAIDGVYDGSLTDRLTSDANLYADLNKPMGSYKTGLFSSPSHVRVATIGGLEFFK